jgi:hypothetical protein
MNIEKIVDDFNNNGLVIIDKFLNQDEISYLKNFADIKYFQNNKNNFFLAGENFEHAYVDKLDIIKKVQKLFFDLGAKLSLKNQDENIYKVLRVVDGKMSKEEAHRYHFDAHLFTVLLPIYIPNNKNNKNGDLIIAPNFRKLSKSLLINIIQKFLYQNFIFKKFLQKRIIRDLFNFKQLNLQVGNLYLFNGYRSLHGNLEINSIDKRATLLIHYYDLFKESKLIQLNRKIRINKEQRKIKKNKNQSNNL